ncbi:hypothetical protein O1L55_28430 [Streptomyces albulus]|nr:hypothetical protein [Streptomyces noursei]
MVRGGWTPCSGEPGFGLQLVSALAESWGVTYRKSTKTVWFRLEATEGVPGAPPAGPARHPHGAATPVRVPPGPGGRPPHGDAAEWVDRGGPRSSPRPANSWPASSTRTWSPRSPRSCWCRASPTGARSG